MKNILSGSVTHISYIGVLGVCDELLPPTAPAAPSATNWKNIVLMAICYFLWQIIFSYR